MCFFCNYLLSHISISKPIKHILGDLRRCVFFCTYLVYFFCFFLLSLKNSYIGHLWNSSVLRSNLTVNGFFLPFLGFIAKSRLFFILEPCSLPKLFLFFSMIFHFILIPIASSFWFPPLIWWVGRLDELWGGRWRHT